MIESTFFLCLLRLLDRLSKRATGHCRMHRPRCHSFSLPTLVEARLQCCGLAVRVAISQISNNYVALLDTFSFGAVLFSSSSSFNLKQGNSPPVTTHHYLLILVKDFSFGFGPGAWPHLPWPSSRLSGTQSSKICQGHLAEGKAGHWAVRSKEHSLTVCKYSCSVSVSNQGKPFRLGMSAPLPKCFLLMPL